MYIIHQSRNFCYILDMPNENQTPEEIDLDAIINNMSSINSEDYWFKKVSQFEEHDETVPGADQKSNG